MSLSMLASTATGPLAALLAFAVVMWVISVFRRDVGVVDCGWSLMILLCAVGYVGDFGSLSATQWLILSMAAIWALRLSLFLLLRNHGRPEDRRYREIREKYEPGFWFKSLFIIFLFQAALAWLISTVFLWPVVASPAFMPTLLAGGVLWAVGLVVETVADAQLYRFTRQRDEGSASSETFRGGLWRYSRHPNYFGEFLVWWGFGLMALPVGGVFALVPPLIMSWLLMKFSGVGLMEEGITGRRPGYEAYVRSTNAFFPWTPKTGDAGPQGSNRESANA